MNLDYARIFEARGHLYHRAMRRAPRARRNEFERLFDAHPVEPGETVLDLPAGGGYLADHLPPGVAITARELAAGFSAGIPVLPEGDWGLSQHQHVVCLAALHHIPDQARFIERLFEHVAPGGTLHLADVTRGSPHARFLDGFVGRYNLTGHHGAYLDRDALPLTTRVADRVVRAHEMACPWIFDSHTAMLDFCAQLFGLVDYPVEELARALEDTIGVRTTHDGVELAWRLTYIDIRAA